MAEKLQTITEIRHRLAGMFKGQWSRSEAGAMATVIIEEYMGLGGARQLAFGTQTVDVMAAFSICSAAVRAASGEPLQYILGYTTFCGHRIEIAPCVLIPRPETEEMTTMIISENPGFSGTATDLCTGSGCIAISVSLAFPGAKVHATDNSEEALKIAARNAAGNGAELNLFKADILTAPAESFPLSNLIFSNPPYVRESEKTLMRNNVLDHEPHEALFVPDSDPLLFYRRIAAIAAERLLKGGRLYCEINESLGAETAQLFAEKGFVDINVLDDFRGKKRILKAEKNGRHQT